MIPRSSSGITPTSAMAEVVPRGRFWAKLHPRECPSTYHPLLAHSADVAAVLRRMLQSDSVLAARLARTLDREALPAEVVASLVYLASLHDLGKVNHSFQDQWRPRSAPSKGHVQVVLDSLHYRPLQQVLIELLDRLGPPREMAGDLLHSAICHHGRPLAPRGSPVIPIWQDDPKACRDPLEEIRRLGRLASAWSRLDEMTAGVTLSLPSRFLHLFAGALTLADWIGSTLSAFPPEPTADDAPHDYWLEAQRRADRACSLIGLTPTTTVVSLAGRPLLERVFPDVFGPDRPTHLPAAEPTPLQLHVVSAELPASGSRVLVESETGSGKTEAALALYARLRAAGRAGGLMFALPTRATATAMHGRVEAAVTAMYEPGTRPTVAIAMGGDQLRAEVSGGEKGANALIADQPDTYPDPAERELVNWSSGGTKKFFAAEIVVGTVDQLLLGGLVVKHAHLRLAALTRHLLVVDELHSYDVYMAEVLRCVLDMNSAAGGVSLLMSATLSDRERMRFGALRAGDFDEQSSWEEAIQRPYPVISTCDGPGSTWIDTPLAASIGSPKPPLSWRLCGEDDGLERAVQAALGGARVCILRSTVKSARATIQRLLEEDSAVGLLWRPNDSPHTPSYHSRYTLPDRQLLDAAVLACFGRGGSSGSGRILVATQVVEQSLDVDFDLLITDLCPIDVLLQRLGRVWRHRERDGSRPAATRKVQAWVIEPGEGLEPLITRRVDRANGWGTVYRHLGFLELTRRAIRDFPVVEISRDSRSLIESVYHGDPLRSLRCESEDWEKHFLEREGDSISREITAGGVVIEFAETYLENAERFRRNIEGSVRTRLGDERVRVRLPAPLPGFYTSERTEAVDLPLEVVKRSGVGLEAPHADGGIVTDGSVEYRLGSIAFRYGPQGWEW